MGADKENGKKALLLGNEAIARGAIEAGVDFCSGYPGTPSTEIMETLIEGANEFGYYAEWSTNEKVALEAAGAVAAAGLRSICTMKCQGLNVASDFLLSTNLAGTKGGFVLVAADDPSNYSTTTEFDTRHYAKMADLPLLEPSTPREAREMTKWAFELSEELGVLVLLRTVTRLSHTRGIVELGEVESKSRQPSFSSSEWYTPLMVPDSHDTLHKKMEKAKSIFEDSRFNRYQGPEKPDLLIITSGLGWPYSIEGVRLLGLEDEVGILKLSAGWPLPEELLKKHLSYAKEALFLEEIDPFHEENVRSLAGGTMEELSSIRFYGKKTGHISAEGNLPGVGEITEDMVFGALSEITGKEYLPRSEEYRSRAKEVTDLYAAGRIYAFCAGCPHRASFWAIRRALNWLGEGKIVTGDIGCYAMGLGPTGYFLLNTLHCMGAGIGTAHGFSKLKQFDFDVPVVAVAGDSTFYHACLPGLVNAKYNGADVLFVILDNETTAMTGHQPHPGTGLTALGEESPVTSHESICRSLDIKTIIQDPFELDEATQAAYGLLQDEGVKVLIFRHPCELEEARKREVEVTVSVDDEKCIGDSCGCARFVTRAFNCPGITWSPERDACLIDETVCTGCGLCADLCPGDAIVVEGVPE